MKTLQAKKMAAYLKRVTRDKRLNSVQLSLYVSILSCWETQNCINQFRITRKTLMELSKIASTSTYHICIKKLIFLGYFVYEPQYDSHKGSRITLL